MYLDFYSIPLEFLTLALLQLTATRAELAAAHENAQTLKEAQAAVQATLAQAHQQLETISASQSEDSAAAAVDRAALLKANDTLNQIKVETEATAALHAQQVSEYEQTIASLNSHVTIAEKSVETLRTECDALKKEREETSQKISELEVEILELKESLEKAEDEKVKEAAALRSGHAQDKEELRKTLEADLAKAIEAHQEAAKKWEEASAAAAEQHSETLASALKEAEETATASSLEAQKALAAVHAEALWEKEVESLHKIEALEKQLADLQAELQVCLSSTQPPNP